MAKPNPAARESLLEAAQHLMLAQGFAATSVDHNCQAAAVAKGAFFHYFKSKDELAKATFDRFCRRGGERYQSAPFLKKSDPLERLNGYVDFTIAQVKHPLRDSCLVGMFSQELADSHPVFRTMCDVLAEAGKVRHRARWAVRRDRGSVLPAPIRHRGNGDRPGVRARIRGGHVSAREGVAMKRNRKVTTAAMTPKFVI